MSDGDVMNDQRAKLDSLLEDAGFILSLVDSSTNFEQLVSLSGMAAFDAFRNLCAMLDAGILGVDA